MSEADVIDRLERELACTDAAYEKEILRTRDLAIENESLRADNERLRKYIESLDGKHIGCRTDDGEAFIDEGIIVASDVFAHPASTQAGGTTDYDAEMARQHGPDLNRER